MICDNIKKVYPGRDGNPEKFAVRGLSLALPQGECFGMLGPSGAGKTSFIEMVLFLCMILCVCVCVCFCIISVISVFL